MTSRGTQRNRLHDRVDLTGEHAVTDIGQIVLAVVFAVVWIADTFFLGSTTFFNPLIPPVARVPPGLIVMAVSLYLARAGLSTVFGEVRNPPQVIRKGVFSLVRHPVYLSEILLYLGLLMLSLSLAAAVVWLAGIGFLHYVSRHEERLLLARFGEDYARYMKEVPMWIPKL